MDPRSDSRKASGEDLVFFIRVQFRRNASWQGTIQWMGGRKTRIFRSVLELGMLINDAKCLSSGKDGEKQAQLSVWENRESVS